MHTKDKKFMKKIAKAMFVLLLCIFVWQGMDRMGNGGNEKSRNLFFYVNHGKTNEICYISCHTEIRRSDKGSRDGRRVTVVHIVEK